jgi:membrane-bound ClpP family serine protease
MDHSTLAIIFIAVGFVLLVAEVFIPTGGALGVMVFLSFATSIYFAYLAWFGQSPTRFWSFVGGLIVMVPVVTFSAFSVLANSSWGDRVLLRAPTSEEVLPYQDELDHLARLIGEKGVAETLLSPGGMVRVGAERLHAFSEGVLINMGEPVEVIAVRGTRILVKKHTPRSSPTVVEDPLAEDDPFLT